MIIVYTKEGCKYCGYAKNLLLLNDIPFKESRLGIDHDGHKVTSRYNWHTYPIILNGSDFIGGFTELQKYLEG